MTTCVEAIYTNGVLKPVERIDLDEHQRVRLTIEPVSESAAPGENNGAARTAARRRLVDFLRTDPLHLTEPLPRRDELYDDRV